MINFLNIYFSDLLKQGYEKNKKIKSKPNVQMAKVYSKRLDTSCPLRLKKRMKHRVEKWPNVISIGFGKCGTGSLAFIDCHPDLVFRAVEEMRNKIYHFS